jgi:ATP-dependent DNA helicase RecG
MDLLHGKMSPKKKDEIMLRFKSGEIQLLISTVVIEVGVDVPNAVIMVIENAERFGLSQLHQLRGRVGRGNAKSTCVLVTDATGDEATARMNIMCETTDGFRLAELDMKLRGAGDINGTQQSGMAFDLKIANPTLDAELLHSAREAAIAVLENDAQLQSNENAGLRLLRARHAGRRRMDFSMIS